MVAEYYYTNPYSPLLPDKYRVPPLRVQDKYRGWSPSCTTMPFTLIRKYCLLLEGGRVPVSTSGYWRVLARWCCPDWRSPVKAVNRIIVTSLWLSCLQQHESSSSKTMENSRSALADVLALILNNPVIQQKVHILLNIVKPDDQNTPNQNNYNKQNKPNFKSIQ